MNALSSFYNEPAHLGNVFGQKGIFYGPKGHLGVDFKKHSAGTPVPSWTAGVVVVAGWSRNLGWIVILRRADGKFAGFCHLLEDSPLSLGNAVAVGQIVGKVGSTGRFSTGPHLHCTLEPTITIGTTNAIDPLPYIRQAVSASASAGDDFEEGEVRPTVWKRTDAEEWMIVAPWQFGPLDKERGYRVTVDSRVGLAWERMFAKGMGTANQVNRDGYIAVQEQARIDYELWLAQGGSVVAPTVPIHLVGTIDLKGQ